MDGMDRSLSSCSASAWAAAAGASGGERESSTWALPVRAIANSLVEDDAENLRSGIANLGTPAPGVCRVAWSGLLAGGSWLMDDADEF